jgi:hypothetical protein
MSPKTHNACPWRERLRKDLNMDRGYDFFLKRNRLLIELAERLRTAEEHGQTERARGWSSAQEDFQARVVRMYQRKLKKAE